MIRLAASTAALLLASFQHPPTEGLSCSITSDKSCYRVGEVPRLKVTIRNNGREAVLLPGSLDGSAAGDRLPHAYFTIDKPRPDTVRIAQCKTHNPLAPDDFRLLPPGGNFDPQGSGFFDDHLARQKESYRNPGTYRIRFYYSTDGTNDGFHTSRWLPQGSAAQAQLDVLLRQVPRITLRSNELVLRFEE
ncbi:hypothetical protein [Flaviaesturariibacter amylovorans]|uniref:DUF2135 domain-containing protein n=1 Tax=Flaviaesturariibacter amylovorans TaxID=1084520 RepID=A0ABP8HUH4_9BACT